MFLEISQNSLENVCARVSFLRKLQAHLFHRIRLGDCFLYFKVLCYLQNLRKLESSFYKIIIFLQKGTTCVRLQAERIFSVNMQYTYSLNFGCTFCRSFSMLFPKAPASCGKKIKITFSALYFCLYDCKRYVSDF